MQLKSIIPTIVATITRHPRQLIEMEWSSNSWTFNLFRIYEVIFGRRDGIRIEASLSMSGVFHAISFEAKVVHTEALLRKGIKALWDSRPRLVWIEVYEPAFAFAGIPNSNPKLKHYRFAIAFDNAMTAFVVNTSTTYTTSGSNRYLVDGTVVQTSGTSIGSVTYAGTAMTEHENLVSDGASDEDLHLMGLANPASGSNTLACTSAGAYGLSASSYSGVNQNTTPDNHAQNKSSGAAATISITPVKANCWMIGCFRTNGNFTSVGTGTTDRMSPLSGYDMCDSNGTISGATSLNMNLASAAWGVVALTLAPVATSLAHPISVFQAVNRASTY